jgi:cell division protein FtsL
LSICLWALVICSALAVIYVKNLERQYVYKLGQVTQINSQLDIERSQLLLESSMWSAPDRVTSLAKRNLNMTSSNTKALIIIPSTKR